MGEKMVGMKVEMRVVSTAEMKVVWRVVSKVPRRVEMTVGTKDAH